eukprot:COSAG02_NODE_19941_length_856_cov_129.722589_1_plen_30_part_10
MALRALALAVLASVPGTWGQNDPPADPCAG